MNMFLACLLALTLSSSAWAELNPVKVIMRDSGYTMGDLLHMRAEIQLGAGEVLDETSLPMAGRVKPWLDLRDLRWRQSGEVFELDMTWQLFATVEIAQMLQTPPIPLRTREGKAIKIPAQGFYYSPVLPYPLESFSRRANLPPFKADESAPLVAALACLLLGLSSGLVWLWLHDRFPWWPRDPGPMTRLARSFRHLPAGEVLQTPQMRDIHAALNLSAGRSLYPQTLPLLFEAAPYLQQEQPAITAFFDCSWQIFHADSPTLLRADEVRLWIARCARSERLHRRNRQS